MRFSIKKGFASLLALILTTTVAFAEEATPAPTSTPQPAEIQDSAIEDDGRIRVLLKSLGQPDSLHLRLAGSYAVEGDAGFRFDRDAEVTLFAANGEVWMQSGGLTIDMGSAVTLTRHAAAEGEENGIYLEESEKDTIYRGDLSVSVEEGALRAVLTIDIEEYLYGVVAYEMSDSFPVEALKAQAVAARTYAMERKFNAGTRDYDVVDTTADQVFKGYDGEYQNVVEAVNATRGVVGTYNGGFAGCYYTASNGGQIALPEDVWGGGGDYGYIEMKDDPYDWENPRSLVNSVTFAADLSDCAALRQMLMEALQSRMEGEWTLESVAAIEPADPVREGSRMFQTLRFKLNLSVLQPTPSPEPTVRPTVVPEASPSMAPSARASATPSASAAARVSPSPSATPAAADHELTLSDLPTATAAPQWAEESVWVELSVYDQIKDGLSIGLNGGDYELIHVVEEADGFTLEMRRFGHGVGMSQRGAQWMAGEYGFSWQQILNFYYPGMTLERIDWDMPELTELEALPVTAGFARPDPTPVPTPAPLPALEEGERYGTVALENDSSTLNVREAPSTAARILDRFADGRRVIVCSEPDAEGWVQIRTAELTGYVLATYLTIESSAD